MLDRPLNTLLKISPRIPPTIPRPSDPGARLDLCATVFAKHTFKSSLDSQLAILVTKELIAVLDLT